jgi:hypothetical protein
MAESRAPVKPVALISMYGAEENIEKIEVSITYPDKRLVAYKSWNNDGTRNLDQVTDEVISFAKEHGVDEIQMLEEVLPI